jgi:hypothetical protein
MRAKAKSIYRGVSRNSRDVKKLWKAQLEHQGVKYNIGVFEDEREAAIAYDKLRIRLGLDPVNILKKK